MLMDPIVKTECTKVIMRCINCHYANLSMFLTFILLNLNLLDKVNNTDELWAMNLIIRYIYIRCMYIIIYVIIIITKAILNFMIYIRLISKVV